MNTDLPTLRKQVSTLKAMRNEMVRSLENVNEVFQTTDVPLQFNTTAPHPTYEIHLIDDLITKLSAELAIESRKEKLAQSA